MEPLEPSPSFTFQKEHSGRRSLFGPIDLVLGFSLLCLVLLLAAWISSVLLSRMFADDTQRTQAQTKQDALNWNQKLEEGILAIPARSEKMKKLLSSHIYGSRLFDFLQNNLLRTVRVVSLDVSSLSSPATDNGGQGNDNQGSGTLTLKGQAADFDSLARQIVWLRERPELSNLTLNEVSRGDQGKLDFTLNLELAPQFFQTSSK